MVFSDAVGRPEKGIGRVILYSWCFTFLAANADTEPIKALTTMIDENMAMVKRAAIVILSNIMFDDDDDAAKSFKKYDEK